MSDNRSASALDSYEQPIRYPLVYRLTKTSQIAAWLLGLLAAAGGVFFLALMVQRVADFSAAAVLGVFALCALAASAYCIASVLRNTLTLDAQAIELRNAFGTRRLQRSDILGRRIMKTRNGSYPLLVAKTGRSLTLQPSSFGLDGRFNAWLDSLPDLDAQDRADTLAMVERDASLGTNAQERLATLDKATRLAKLLNLLPMGLIFWGFLYPRPYVAVVACAALLPWIAVLLVWVKPGVFRFDGKNSDVRPNLTMLLIMPPMVLAMRALFDVTLVDLGQLFLWGFVAGLPLCAAILAAPKTPSSTAAKPWLLPLVLLPFMAAYGTGLLALADSMWDDAKPQVFQTAVTGKDVSRGKSTTYYLELAPWSRTVDKDRIAVPRSYYDMVDRGDTVCVRLHPGRFGLRWMQVGGCS